MRFRNRKYVYHNHRSPIVFRLIAYAGIAVLIGVCFCVTLGILPFPCNRDDFPIVALLLLGIVLMWYK